MVRAAPGGARGAIGFATREAVETERGVLGLEAQGRARFQPLHDRFEAARIVICHLPPADRIDHAYNKGPESSGLGSS